MPEWVCRESENVPILKNAFGEKTYPEGFLYIGAFHLVPTHQGRLGGAKPPIHFHCVLHAKSGWVGLDSL